MDGLVADVPSTQLFGKHHEKVCKDCAEGVELRYRLFFDHTWEEYCPKCRNKVPLKVKELFEKVMCPKCKKRLRNKDVVDLVCVAPGITRLKHKCGQIIEIELRSEAGTGKSGYVFPAPKNEGV